MQRVLDIIRRDVSEDKVKIDTPTQNLESYFLDVVQKARQSAAETSGATSGSRVAAYLRGEADEKPSTDKVLERLTLPAAAAEEKAEASEPVEQVNQAKLEALARPTEAAAPPPARTPEPEPAKQADLAKANEKLSSLLGKPK
jgi:hypothetical protein